MYVCCPKDLYLSDYYNSEDFARILYHIGFVYKNSILEGSWVH